MPSTFSRAAEFSLALLLVGYGMQQTQLVLVLKAKSARG
jgi:hypothetical protein